MKRCSDDARPRPRVLNSWHMRSALEQSVHRKKLIRNARNRSKEYKLRHAEVSLDIYKEWK